MHHVIQLILHSKNPFFYMVDQIQMVKKNMKAGHIVPTFHIIRRDGKAQDFPTNLGGDVILFLRTSSPL